jgi:uncharacterized membrane protein YfcA
MTFNDLGLPSDVLLWKAGILTTASFAIGVLGGFVGLSLSILRLPTLLLIGVPAPVAAGTNLIVSGASSVVGAISHYRGGRVNLRLVITMGLPSFVGAFIGGFYAHLVPEDLLILAIGVLVMWQGIKLVNKALREVAPGSSGSAFADADAVAASSGPAKTSRTAVASTIGLVIGLAGGAGGLILGSLRIPALIRILGVDPRVASGTNMFIGSLMCATGWIAHVARGHVDYPLIFLLAASAMIGVAIGSRYTERVSLQGLVITLGIVMAGSGALLIARGVF